MGTRSALVPPAARRAPLVDAIAGGPRKRRPHDLYPTGDGHAVAALLRSPWGGALTAGKIWEPACGHGDMAKVMRGLGHRVVATDLVDRGWPGQDGTRDFLNFDPLEAPAHRIVTNPPWNAADRFIHHANFMGVEAMALLLKADFWHSGGRTALWRAWRPAAVLALTWRIDFTGQKRPMKACIWCVWLGWPPCGAVEYGRLARDGTVT